MEFKNFIYLLYLLIIFSGTLLLGVYRQKSFFDKLKYLLPSIIFTGIIFIMWDSRFTELGIWTYHPAYFSGMEILNLPFEQWLLLLVFPVFSVFIYEYLNIKLSRFEKPNLFLTVSLILLPVFGLLAWFSQAKLYTFFTFFLLTIYFGYTIFRNRFKNNLTKFYLSYFISVVPFFILKVVLFSLKAVTYNTLQISGITILNVPIEDFGYFFLLLLINITVYEFLKSRQFY